MKHKKHHKYINIPLKFAFIVLLLFNCILPVVFAWLVEIGMEFRSDSYYTNGFWNTDPIKMYHIALNAMFDVCFFTTVIILYNIDKIVTTKK